MNAGIQNTSYKNYQITLLKISVPIIMKKQVLIALALLIGMTAAAQTYKATGVVVDSLGTPLAMANVIAYQKDKNLGAFGITNMDGKYMLTGLKQDSTYTVKVSYLGLRPLEEIFKPTKTDIVKNFVLKGGPDQLDAIEINYQIPITIKGDTITYNADSFTNGQEDKLGDVLKKLPGIEVNEDGDIQVEGQTVEKVMVDGKDFFEGDSRLATKNIPANAVGKVEVLKNYNSQSQLKGLGNDQDRYVINIKLKEGKKKFWFGEATVGAGHGGGAERYLVQPKAFYYSEDFSVNIITDLNNLGVPAFTGRDYFRFLGFRNFDTRQNNASIDIQPVSSFGAAGSNRALSVDSKFGAINTSWKVNEKLDLSAFAILSGTQTRTGSLRDNLFIGSGLQENTTNESLEDTFSGLFKLGGDYNPNSKLSIKYDGRFSISDENQVTAFTSSRDEIIRPSNMIQRVDEDIAQSNNQQPVSYNQNISMYYTAADNHIFALESQFLNQLEDPFYNAIRDRLNTAEEEPFNGALGLDAADPFNINQERFINTNKLDAKLDYWYVINKTSNINFTFGTTIASQNFSTNIFQIRDDASRNDLQDPTLRNNNVQYDFRDLFAAVHYKIISGKFTITPGVTLHDFQTKDIQLGVENVINTTKLLPDLVIRFQLKNSETLNLTYDRNVVFTDVENYAEGIVFRNYNQLQSGNNQLGGALNDRVVLRYNNNNMFNYTFINAGLTYEKRQDAIQSQVLLDGINQVSSPINALLANESASGNVSYSREVRKIRLGASARLNWSLFNNIINAQVQESVNILQDYGLSARSNFRDGINFNLGYNLGYNNADAGGVINNSVTNTYSASIDWEIGKRWLLRSDYNYNNFSANGQENSFDFLNATLRYQKPSSRWQYSLIANNLLNATAIVNNTFGQIVTSTSQTFVLPRYVYFQMRFDI